jgi:hypothetical protein
MNTAVRRHIAAGIAIVGASAIAVAPIAPPPPTPPAIDVAKVEVRLANSILNIPTNLINAIVNIPYSETQALNQFSASLFYTGNWFAPSATNIWGTDPGDPGHFESLASLLIPFPALSSVLGNQLAMIAAAELPVNKACDVESCFPQSPVDPIFGLTSLDSTIQLVSVLLGLRSQPLVDGWLKVPLSELLAGYTFPTVVSPSAGVGENGAVPDGFGWEGTHVDPVTGENVMPWSGTTFKWDPLLPFTSFYDSLTADPDTTGVFGTGVHIPSLGEIARAFQSLLAGLVVDFNPLVPGSPVCPGECAPESVLGLTTPVIVKFISDVWPGNPLIEKWLELDKQGLANGITPAQVPGVVKLLQPAVFTFKPETTAAINALLAKISPLLPRLAADSGLLGHPDRDLLTKDLNELFGIDTPSDTTPTDGTSSDTTPADALTVASLTKKLTSQAAQPVSAKSIPSAAAVEPDSQVAEDEQPSESIEPAVGTSAAGTAVNADAAPIKADPRAGQTTESASEPVEKPAPTTTTSNDPTSTDPTSAGATGSDGSQDSGKADSNSATAGKGDTGGDDAGTGGGKAAEGSKAGKHRADNSDARKRDTGNDGGGKAAKPSTDNGNAGEGGGRHRAE